MFNSTSCVICGYSITDPVCRGCYIKQTKVLLQDLKINSITNNFISDKVKDIFPIETLNKTRCILCKKENVTLCRYCFSIILIRVLRELNFTEELIEEFEYDPSYGDFSLEKQNMLDNMEMI